MFRSLIVLAALSISTVARAQEFNQFLVFGPSLLDSGYFKLQGGDPHFTAARNAGAAMTPSGGIMNTTILAERFGLGTLHDQHGLVTSNDSVFLAAWCGTGLRGLRVRRRGTPGGRSRGRADRDYLE
jgi:hypothetical protein